MPNENHCHECGAPVSDKAITCGNACRVRRHRRVRLEKAISGALDVSAEVGALVRAVEVLTDEQRRVFGRTMHELAERRNAKDDLEIGDAAKAFSEVLFGFQRALDRREQDERRARRAAKRERYPSLAD